VSGFIFGIEPEIDVVVFHRKTFIQITSGRTGTDFPEPVLCMLDHMFFYLVHILSIGISFLNI
jgi:hypothetical protein